MPAASFRSCAQVGAAIHQQQQALQAAYMKLSPVCIGFSASNMLYSGSVRAVACHGAAAVGGILEQQLLEAVRLSSIAYIMNQRARTEDLLLTTISSMLLHTVYGSCISSSSKQVNQAAAFFM